MDGHHVLGHDRGEVVAGGERNGLRPLLLLLLLIIIIIITINSSPWRARWPASVGIGRASGSGIGTVLEAPVPEMSASVKNNIALVN